MKYTASILILIVATVKAGTNKTLAPTPGVIRPTPFPSGGTRQPTRPPITTIVPRPTPFPSGETLPPMKTIVPTPGVFRPTPFPTGGTTEPSRRPPLPTPPPQPFPNSPFPTSGLPTPATLPPTAGSFPLPTNRPTNGPFTPFPTETPPTPYPSMEMPSTESPTSAAPSTKMPSSSPSTSPSKNPSVSPTHSPSASPTFCQDDWIYDYRELTWSDYKGNVPFNPKQDAETATGLTYDYSTIIQQVPPPNPIAKAIKAVKRQIKWQATLASIESTISLDRCNSWVKAEAKSDDLLNHQQGHFDISECWARELNKALQGFKDTLVGTGNSSELAEADLLKQVDQVLHHFMTAHDLMQKDYDSKKETDYGEDGDKQDEWDTKIQDWLMNGFDDSVKIPK